MIIRRDVLLSIAVALLVAACGGGESQPGGEEMETSQPPPLPPDVGNPYPQVVLETNMGEIVMELDREAAPNTVENIVEHVENGFYDGLLFHRVMPGFMIQTGSFTVKVDPLPGSLSTLMAPSWASIMRLAMARPRPVPDLFSPLTEKKGSKISSRFSFWMPAPVSETSTRAQKAF